MFKLILFLLVFQSLVLNAFSQSVTPSISCGSVSGAVGSTISVPIIGNFPQATSALQFTLQYDKNLLQWTGLTIGSGVPMWAGFYNPNVSGVIVVGMMSTGTGSIMALGTAQQVAVINFKVLNPPTGPETSAPFTITNAIFASSPIPTVTPGTFTLSQSGGIPVITSQPVSVTVKAASSPVFSVTAIGTPAPAYQWMYSDNGAPFVIFPSPWGQNSSIGLAPVTTADVGYKYYCVVSNSAGSVQSNTVSLTVST